MTVKNSIGRHTQSLSLIVLIDVLAASVMEFHKTESVKPHCHQRLGIAAGREFIAVSAPNR